MKWFCLLLCIVFNCLIGVNAVFGMSYPEGSIEPRFVPAQQGDEKLVYEISWSGGIKIGDVWMEVNKLDEAGSRFELRVRVKDSGLFHFFYPVDDSFVTIIDGKKRLPLSYDVIQKEGTDYTAIRHTTYNQEKRTVRYQKNEEEPQLYMVDGDVHNEFSSFFITRLLNLDRENSVTVPTFADDRRHEVVVKTGERTRLTDTVRGDVNVFPVKPLMKFKGLYDKDGDTVVWLTDDDCRIPVLVNSKIVIGSLTATLVSYSNPFCSDQSVYHSER